MCRRPYVDNGAWLRELVWVGGCVAAAAWASGPSVLASRGHGAVDVVGPVALPGRASGRGDKGVYTDRRKRPLGAVLGHLCGCAVVGRRGSKGVYTDRRKRPYGAVLGHLCTLLRREPRRVERRPRSPWRAGAGAAASLASLLRRSLTQTPEEPNDAWLALTIIAVVIGCTVSSFHSPYGSGQRLVLLGYTG